MRALFAVAVAACGFHSTAAVDAHVADAPAGEPDAPADAPPRGIAFVQINNTEGQNLLSVDVPFLHAQTAGDLNVIAIGWFKTGSVQSVVDSAGNTYVVGVGQASGGMESSMIYYACGIRAAATNTVTVTFATNNQDADVRVVEYSGPSATSCFDVGRSASGNSIAMDTGTQSTNHAHDVIVAATFQTNMTSASDATYTNRLITGFGDLVEDQIVSTTGSYHARATQDIAGDWVMQLAAFTAD